MTQTTKVDIKLHGKSHSVRLAIAIWSAFRAKAASLKLALSDAAIEAQRDCNGTLAEAITKWVGDVPLHTTRELWTAALVDAMRPVFERRGYPLPANIRATIAFTSQGWKGKARGECWNADMSADGATEIMVHLCETDPVRILNILTHELCHAAQFHQAKLSGKPITKKAGHGKTFAVVAEALDLKPTVKTGPSGKERTVWDHALGDANGLWGAWAKPLLEAAGAMPHAALAEFVKKEKDAAKQSTRMLKFEHADCGGLDEGSYIWRASGKATADKPKVSCPCCGMRIENPHFKGAEDEDGHILDDVSDERKFVRAVDIVADEMDARAASAAESRRLEAVGRAVKKAVAKRRRNDDFDPENIYNQPSIRQSIEEDRRRGR